MIAMVCFLVVVVGSVRAELIDEGATANGTPATAIELQPGDYGRGSIGPANTDEDWWFVGGAAPGDLVFAYVDARAVGGDTVLEIWNRESSGTLMLLERDDADGPVDSSVVAGAHVMGPGAVYFRVLEDGQNDHFGPYHLFQAVVDGSSPQDETEPNDLPATATPVSSALVWGSFGGDVDVDYFSFDAVGGDTVVVLLDTDADDDDNFVGIDLAILDTDGVTVLAHDGVAPPPIDPVPDGEAVGALEIPAPGTYFVRAGPGTFGRPYRFTVIINGGAVPVELQAFEVD